MGDIKRLRSILTEMGSLAVAFSGGADSSFLLSVAADIPEIEVAAITAVSPAFPDPEKNEAVEFCTKRGIRHIIFEGNELEIKEYRENSPKRCYFCKKHLFTEMLKKINDAGIKNLVDGSNTDDIGDFRPGLEALKELGIRSPLQEAGFSKSQIRSLSREMGLVTWDKPSFACLATRFPYGEEINAEKLKMAGKAEDFLRTLGYRQFRVRVQGKTARIELLQDDIESLMDREVREKIVSEFEKIGFVYVSLDMKGYRSGSMNEIL